MLNFLLPAPNWDKLSSQTTNDQAGTGSVEKWTVVNFQDFWSTAAKRPRRLKPRRARRFFNNHVIFKNCMEEVGLVECMITRAIFQH
jgi:hypothetical protein